MKKALLLGAVASLAGLCWSDWPQFQGPNRDGVSTETVKLADTWPEGGPKVAWKKERMGTGYAGAVIEGRKVYVLDRVNDQKDTLRCIDLETGAEDWDYSYDCPGKYKGNYNGSRNLPAVDAKYVFTLGPFGQLTCVSKETHEAVWQKNIVEEYGATITNWGLCQSPTMYKDTVIVAPMSDKAGAVAFDKATGREVWKSERLGRAKDVLYSWTSPLVATVDGQDMVVVLSCRTDPNLTGIDATNGKGLWNYRGWKCPNPIASPIAIPGGRFFVTGGYNSGGALVKVSKAGDKWNVEEVFNNKALSSQAQNPIFYKGFIYGNSSGNKAGVECIDLNGEVKWKTENSDPEEIGAILIADGKLFSFLSQKGTLRMLAASPDGCKELTSAKVVGGTENWGVMGYADGRLLIRARRVLICLDLR
ncbi:MAG TPA: PQQ-binding-like beta-propeller repeat protein [Planctomycetota bacterium]|nr:PQQ-binding-like beta-propeller repeat protein [Planctomycetota bacterium]